MKWVPYASIGRIKKGEVKRKEDKGEKSESLFVEVIYTAKAL